MSGRRSLRPDLRGPWAPGPPRAVIHARDLPGTALIARRLSRACFFNGCVINGNAQLFARFRVCRVAGKRGAPPFPFVFLSFPFPSLLPVPPRGRRAAPREREPSSGRRGAPFAGDRPDSVSGVNKFVRKGVTGSGPMLSEDLAAPEWAIAWRGLSVSVGGGGRSVLGRAPPPRKRLIHGARGAIRAGSLAVVMGPSGAGKSTLMGALAHRNAKEVSVEGDVRVEGAAVGRFVHGISGFMHQEDLFVDGLTVREHLFFMGKLKLGGSKSEVEIRRRVEALIVEMGLTGCANTRIGSGGEAKGISGGERKRLAFATEVLTDPPILFCDEPTTGLDSFAARHLVGLMRGMSSRGKTILCTIHQPSSEVFWMFQQVILLADGSIVFMGDAESALEFFEKHGITCPPNHNPAEMIVQALSSTSSKQTTVAVKKLCNEFSVSETARKVDEILREMAEKPSSEVNARRSAPREMGPSWLTKTYWLTYRSFLQVLRDPSIQGVRILQKLGIALMAGLCFLGTVDLTQAGIQSVQGAIFILVTENTFPPMYGVLSLFPQEFPLYMREYKNNLYSPLPYYLSKVLSYLPGLVLEPVLFVSVAYALTGLKRTFYAFAMTTSIAILTTNVAAACGCFFSSAFGSVSMALAFLVPVDYALMVTSGLFMRLSSIPGLVSWFRHLSWFMYSNEALSIVQWQSVYNITCEYDKPEMSCLLNGEDVLENFDFASAHLPKDLLAMALLYCLFHALAYLTLCWKTKRAS